MSDYLNNLVARTLNLAPLVQPRLKSLFEPVGALGSSAGEAWRNTLPEGASERAAESGSAAPANRIAPDNAETDLVASRTPHAVSASTSLTAYAVSHVRKAGFAGEHGNEDETHQDRDGAAKTPATFGAALTPADAPSASEGGFQTNDPHQLVTQLLAHRRTTARTVQARLVEKEAADKARSRGQVESTTAIIAPLAGSASQPNPNAMEAPDFVTLPVATLTNTNLPAIPDQFSSISTRRAVSYLPDRRDQSPTINVTIGRVDVRAIIASPVQRPARAARPAAMSLDQYLNERGGGRK